MLTKYISQASINIHISLSTTLITVSNRLLAGWSKILIKVLMKSLGCSPPAIILLGEKKCTYFTDFPCLRNICKSKLACVVLPEPSIPIKHIDTVL